MANHDEPRRTRDQADVSSVDGDPTTVCGPDAIRTALFGFGPPAEPGEIGVLGPYRIVRELGRGGMGAVFEAVDTRLGRPVALKVMLPTYAADPASRERFLREARTAARINHDHVVTVFEADERDGVAYIAMPLLRGLPLDKYLKEHGTPRLPLLLRIAAHAASGLAAAHAIGLVHRDVKPSNLWLEEPSGRVKVLDFGTAKPVDVDCELTRHGTAVGTPAYMAPEQARGETVDARADLFGLGASLYRLCTGRLPFPGTTAIAVLSALATQDPPPLRSLCPEVPERLADLIHQLLAKNPADRPRSATEVADRVRLIELGLDDPPTREIVVTSQPQPPKPPRRARVWVAVGLTGLLLAAAVAGIVIFRNADGTAAKVTVPTGATEKGEIPPDPVKPASDPDREAAEYVLSLGGSVWVNGEAQDRKAVADLPAGRFTLTAANLQKCQVTDAGLAAFRGCKGLVGVNLYHTGVTDAGLAHFKDCTGLTHLLLSFTKTTDAGLAHFKGCDGLQELHLFKTQVTDAGLERFKGCTTITALHLGETKVTDDGLANFAGCKGMKELHLYNMNVSDAGMKHFEGCDGLTLLGLNYTRVSDDGLGVFKDCGRLKLVFLDGTKVTDAGLKHLHGCQELKQVWLLDSRVTADGVKGLRAAVPGVKVEHSAKK